MSERRIGRVQAIGLVLAMVVASDLQAQTTMSSRPISPTVLASFVIRGDQLALLVLWRGSPGWFWRTDGAPGGGGGTGEQMFQLIGAGGFKFRIDYDFIVGTATIEGHHISLREANIVLVDNVDSLGGPVVLSTQRTDPIVSEPLSPETLVIRRSADLYRFLQCELPLPPSADPVAPFKQALINFLCDRVRNNP